MDAVSEKSQEGDLMDLYEYSAEKGDTKAQLYLGYANLLGWNGLPQNPQRAVELFSQAAQGGEAAADAALGQVGKPPPRVFLLSRFAVSRRQKWGGRFAQTGGPQVYANGMGVAADNKTALEHFRRGADKVVEELSLSTVPCSPCTGAQVAPCSHRAIPTRSTAWASCS